VVVVGGGFFGGRIAEHLSGLGLEVLLVEQEADLLQRASYNNQARVHQGYHYPRSLLTALRSRVNFGRFAKDYPDCVFHGFTKYYAIGRQFSHVTAPQFRSFCERIGAPLDVAPADVRRLFNRDLIEEVFLAQEWVFDAVKLKERVRSNLASAGVEVRLSTRAIRVSHAPQGRLAVELAGPRGVEQVQANHVLNCTYSGLNHLLNASSLPVIPLKHEGTEMALIEPPPQLSSLGITVMCGPFFSLMPFPPRGLHTLSHVRYTPHHEWHDRTGVAQTPEEHRPELKSRFDRMVRDAARFMPCLADSIHRGSLWEVKTVLPASEQDDSRPILFKVDHGLPGLICVMGGKIDNVYDAIQELDELRLRGGLS
jgi:glycine/D-amino acid oxidase-like deaminating enzyme